MNKLFEKKFIVCDQNKIINIKVLKKHINDHNIHSIFNLLFNFQNLRDVYNNFSIIDNVFNLSNIKLSSLEVFNETYIELRKRRVCFRYRDFILIFLYNCLFLYLYINKYHHIKNGVNNINNGYHTKKFFKATKLGSIKNFTSLDLTNSFVSGRPFTPGFKICIGSKISLICEKISSISSPTFLATKWP